MFDLALTTFFLLCAGIAFAVIVHSTRAGVRHAIAICRELRAMGVL